ncbi:MAG: lipocalin family protein, partial [Rhodobacteraceae bacterium]|nr:lipocalin family protein [Paracoccaceae bacterium]
SSSTAFDPARFQGDWQVVAAYGLDAACGALQENWLVAEAGFAIRGTACTAAGKRGFVTQGSVSGPGRVLRDGPAGPVEQWILWVDADYRVAAVGTPSGAFGHILARPGMARTDLMKAAREIMDFNGYDISRLIFLN